MENIRIPWKDWKVVRQLGKGSYGTVYEIERTLGGYTEKAAMKVIPIPPDRQIIDVAYSDGYDDKAVSELCESYLNKILQEYQTMRVLNGHKNIVSCSDVEYLPFEDKIGWEVYIRMELLSSFSDYLHRIDPANFSNEDVLHLGKDICQALIACEDNTIVHRDIKPENIFLTDDGDYKLGDFGVARSLDHATNATRVGTERFMAPEVIKQSTYGKNVDLYSLGLVMYWLLNGRKMPFLKPGIIPTSEELDDANARRLSGESLPFPTEGSPALNKIVLKACAYDSKERYQSAREMLQDLLDLKVNNSKNNISDESTQGNSWFVDSKTIGADFEIVHPDYDEPLDPTQGANSEFQNNRESNNHKSRQRNNIIIWLCIGIVAIAVVVALYLFITSNSNNDNNTVTTNTIISKNTIASNNSSDTEESNSNNNLMPIYKSDEVVDQLEVTESLTNVAYTAKIKNGSIYTFNLKWAVYIYNADDEPLLYHSDVLSSVEPGQEVVVEVPLDDKDASRANLYLTPRPIN